VVLVLMMVVWCGGVDDVSGTGVDDGGVVWWW